ncbi:MAG: hypothetical protein JF593_11265 [Novosphingobium sp.]|nr:hypothetical protein [Novosphingobium sp.]
MTGAELADAAERLVGCPFRLHGRDPATGLDCLGVLAAALASGGRVAPLPTRYTLRRKADPLPTGIAESLGLVPTSGAAARGDVLLFDVGPCQLHLAVAAGDARLVHAHAGLRRVVVGPLPPEWRRVAHWRLIPS